MVKEYYAITNMDGEASYLVYEPKGGLMPLNNPDVNDDAIFSKVHKLKNLEDLIKFDRKKEKKLNK